MGRCLHRSTHGRRSRRAAFPEVLWTFHSRQPAEALLQRLAPGVDRSRVMLYADIDCNSFLPKLCAAWSTLERPAPLVSYSRSNSVHVSETTAQQILTNPRGKVVVEGDDEDRPPLIELCVGRERELQNIKYSPAKILFVTGLGGQGKSTLAAKYFADSQHTSNYSYLVWRDCKDCWNSYGPDKGSCCTICVRQCRPLC